MENINEYLNKRSKELMVYRMPRNESLMKEIFKYDPRVLESTSSLDISKYAIGLAQFLIYFSSQINKSKVLLMQKKKYLEDKIMVSDIPKGRMTKADHRLKIIHSDEELKKVKIDIEALEQEITMTENMERYYIELINTFKRELSRRETEFRLTRDERKL